MPLIVATLQTELVGILDKPKGNPVPTPVAMDIAKAYLNFCSAGIDSGGSPFVAMPGSSALGQDLDAVLSKTNAAGTIAALDMAKAFDSCLQTFKTSWQTTIVTAAGLGALSSELSNLFSSTKPSAMLFAQDLAKAINNFTAAAIVSGMIPGSPPVPYTGPIS
jgi:hypothetical protein